MAAVSMMSWLVAPLCTAAAASGGTSRASSRASAGTGLPVSAACWPSAARSKLSARAAAVTAAPAPGAASPAASSARASAASVSSIACSQAWPDVSTWPRLNTPSKSPPGVCTAPR